MVLKFSTTQFAAFEREAATVWDADTARSLQELYPDYIDALGVKQDKIEAFCRTVRDHALAYQITTKREVFKLIVIAVSLGAYFPHDPRFGQGVTHSLGRSVLPQAQRVSLMADFTASWLGASWDGMGIAALGLRLVDLVRNSRQSGSSRDGIRDALSGLVLQSPTIATPERREAFLDACLSHADGYGLHEPQRRVAYIGGAFLHGIYWFDDPLLAKLRDAISEAQTPDALYARMTAFYEGFA